jgi:RNA polymerase sigma factor (sigma-70 family)
MDSRYRFTLLDEHGQPLDPRIEQALVSLVPKFQRDFPVLRDDFTLVEIFEEAGRRIENREKGAGRIERRHGYAWVTRRSIATSRLRRGEGRMAPRTLAAEEGAAALDATPTREGTADQIERTILLREVLDTLTPDERLVCIWKKAGFSSQEIANRRGGTAAAVDTMLSRVRQKVRRLLGGNIGGARRERPNEGSVDTDQESSAPARGEDENPNGR